jgi:phosphoheptose isomerase
MTFPEKKYPEIAGFADGYFARLHHAAASVDRNRLAEAASVLEQAYLAGATLYVCGNGGSAAIADSFVCDHAKLIRTGTSICPRVLSLSANVPMLTAIANDISYDDIFIYQIQGQARPGDVVLTVSASGNSENVVRAAAWARDNGLAVIALTGFQGGRTADLATVHLHVDAQNYGVVEDVLQSLMHILAQYIRQKHMPESEVAVAKF